MRAILQSFLVLTIIFLSLSTKAQVSFYKNYQLGANDSQVFDITGLSTGGYAMTGIMSNDTTGVSEVALTKLSCDGNVEWAKKFGNSSTINNVFSAVIEVDNGDIVLVNNVGGFQNYDFIIVRITPDGQVVWKQRYGGNRNDKGHGIIQTQDGHLVVTGSTGSWGTDTSGSASYSDVYLLKIDANTGSVIWSKTYGNNGAIDAGYALTEDADGNLFSTGRFLVDGTFYTYILKTDADGNVDKFKGFGAGNHRTYGYDIEVSAAGEVLITGSTTINKEDHTSLPDVYLIKTDADLVPHFTNIYYVWVGEDRSESGSSLVLQEDGGYGIGVPTMSFTNWSSGFVPNKNAVYSIESDGNIGEAFIYNQGGSHYTRLRKDLDGGYIISNFSNFFSNTFEFIPLIVKTDDTYDGGCNMIDVTGEIEIAFEDWDMQDISYTMDTGSEVTNFSPEGEFYYSLIDSQCEEVPTADASFDYAISTSGVLGTYDFTNTSPSPGIVTWDFGDGNTSEEENPTHTYTSTGVYEVCMTIFANCSTVEVCQDVEVTEVGVGVTDLSESPYRVFPNPVVDDIVIQSPTNFMGLQQIELFDATGKLLLQQEAGGELHQSQIWVAGKNLPGGMYYLKLRFDGVVYGVKVVK